MKLRTSFCNGTVLKKDITRFAPLWAVYLVGGLLVMLTSISGLSGMTAGRDLARSIPVLVPVNMIYAAICAQVLFGDLFRSRMCNALHAMPLRRECWFFTHVIAGVLFSLVPHGIATVCMALFLQEAWFVALIWLLAMTLQYLFFFGLAVFCVFCVGNRVAQTAVYGILNFGAAICYWFLDTMYAPLLYGLRIPSEPFMGFCPVVQLCGVNDLVRFERVQKNTYYYENSVWKYKGLGEGWDYLALCAVIGVALLGLALLLYRRRKLETAGNFIAVRPMEPIFQVVFTLCAGAVFAAVGQLFDEDAYVVYLIVGLVLGWFVGQMLLRRTVKVFQWKTFVKLAIFALFMGATLAVTSWDPLGITTWVPEKDTVAWVEVDTGTQVRVSSSMYLKLETEEEVENLLKAHKAIVAAGEPKDNNIARRWNFTIVYTLHNGQKVTRYYQVYADTPAWALFRILYNDPEKILGYTDWESFVDSAVLSVNGEDLKTLCLGNKEAKLTEADYQRIRLELLVALKKDCEAGNLTMDMFEASDAGYAFGIDIRNGTSLWQYLTIRKNAVNTMAWYQTYKSLLQSVVK